MEVFLSVFLKPFLLLALLCLAYPVKRYVERLPDSKTKRFLLFGQKTGRGGR
jgi:uncharacterized membrane protein YbaN (DUF454 family)